MAWGAGAPPARFGTRPHAPSRCSRPAKKAGIPSQTCDSCHHQFQAALAFQSAREHGIPVDEKIAHADAVKAFNYTDLDIAVQYNWVIEPAMDDAYQLVAADAAGIRPNLVTAFMRDCSPRGKTPTDPGPVSISGRRRPIASSPRPHCRCAPFSCTAFRARKPMLSCTWRAGENGWPRTSLQDTEARTYQLLGLWWAGADRSELKKLAKALLAMQQPDGGWASLDGRESDAYSTGEVLVALHDAGGVSISDSRWQRGIGYLLKTQAADGSWHVVSRLHPPASVSPPYFESGYPYGHDQFLSALAADWDVMALARALGPGKKAESPELKEGEPSGLEPWAETVLFGDPIS